LARLGVPTCNGPGSIADVTEGSGHYNLARGASAMAWGLGAALSNGVAGYVVDLADYKAAFPFLGGCAALALLVLWLAVPKTCGGAHRSARAGKRWPRQRNLG
jgi:predicted MFS family arabinose efflux permease